jgi:dienelactone hydrolase/uncharacterized RmlC-like cupin family protein
MKWTQSPTTDRGVRRQPFELQVDGRTIPGTVYLPEGSIGPVPLVLVQHGGSQHAESDGVLALVRLFVGQQGWAVAAIDGPVHGRRREDWTQGPNRSGTQDDFRTLWRSSDNGTTTFLVDWQAAITSLLELPEIDDKAIAWVGLSMGTAYGLPLLARERRIQVAVMGQWSADYAASDALTAAAVNVMCPVLFQQKWDDELMSREGQTRLFEALGTLDKQLRVYMGGHTDPGDDQLDDIKQFVVKRLKKIVQAQMKAGRRVDLGEDVAQRRISRFNSLTPTVKRQERDNGIQAELYEQLSAHRTYVFMAPRGLGGPISGGAGVVGGDAGEVFRVGIAVCPPGNGPAMHLHLRTHETFINTRGRWEVSWGEQGQHSTVLEPYDIFACPPGVMRTFKNIDSAESHLMVIIQGDRDDFDDVYQSMASKEKIVRQYGPEIVDRIRPAGLRFVDELPTAAEVA